MNDIVGMVHAAGKEQKIVESKNHSRGSVRERGPAMHVSLPYSTGTCHVL